MKKILLTILFSLCALFTFTSCEEEQPVKTPDDVVDELKEEGKNYDHTQNRAPRMSEITQAGKDLQEQAGANNKGSDQGKINEAE